MIGRATWSRSRKFGSFSMPVMAKPDSMFMRMALDQARNAEVIGEVPVGAVIVRDGDVIATGFNRVITEHDPTAHAEIVAIREAAQKLGNYRLTGLDLYVTLEPCAMCVGAMLHARLGRIVFGAADPKTGACGGALDVAGVGAINHRTTFDGGVLADECAAVLREFFAARRAKAVPATQASSPGPDGTFDIETIVAAPAPDHDTPGV